MVLTGSIVLCGRGDGDGSRAFSGALSQLTIFDVALSAQDVAALYSVVDDSGAAASAGETAQASCRGLLPGLSLSSNKSDGVQRSAFAVYRCTAVREEVL